MIPDAPAPRKRFLPLDASAPDALSLGQGGAGDGGSGAAGAGGGLARFLLLYGALYGAYGCLSPVLPNVLAARGLSPAEIGLVLSGATLTRLVAGPIAGRAADRSGAAATILAAAAGLAGLAALAHLAGQGFPALLALGLAYAVATAPLAPLADALALTAARDGRAFQYGWVRGAGLGCLHRRHEPRRLADRGPRPRGGLGLRRRPVPPHGARRPPPARGTGHRGRGRARGDVLWARGGAREGIGRASPNWRACPASAAPCWPPPS